MQHTVYWSRTTLCLKMGRWGSGYRSTAIGSPSGGREIKKSPPIRAGSIYKARGARRVVGYSSMV